MEPWKILLLVAALPTAASIFLSFMNKGALMDTIDNRQQQEMRVENTRNRLERTQEELADTQMTTRNLNEETESLQTQLASLQASVSEKELKIQTLTDDIRDADEEIAKFDELKRIVGDIAALDEQIADINKEIRTLEDDVMNVENLLAVETAKKEQSGTQIERLEAMEKYRKTGQMWNDVNTTVKAAYNDWGFVIIEAGDVDGLVPAATLDVTRGGKPICKLLVTEVEIDQAVADIITATLIPGQTVQVGDVVTKKATVSLP